MQDAPEQAQAAEAPDTVAETAALETSTPETQEPTEQNPTTVADLDAMADEILNPKAPDEKPKAEEKPAEKPAEEETTEEATPEAKAPDRVRLSALKDHDKALVNNAVQMVRDGLAEDIPSAILKITGKTIAAPEAPKAAEEKQEAPATVDPYAAIIEGKTTELANLEAELAKAEDDFADGKTKAALLVKISKLQSDIGTIEYRREMEAQAAEKAKATEAEATYQSYYEDYKQQAETLYADAADPDSALYAQIQQDVAWFEQNNPAIFNTPNYPLLIAGGAAAKLGIAPKFANAAAAAPQAPAAAATQSPNARVAARPANPLVGGTATTVSSDTKSAARQVESIRSIHDLDALAEATFSGR